MRTPLNGVFGMLILLEKTPLSAQQSEYIRAAQDAGNHLLHTINDILDFSKLEANKQALDFVDINLQDFLSRLVEPYKHTAKKRNNALLLAIDNSVPGSLVSDPNCIRQLLTNLISNAIKFTHNGTIWVKVYIDKNKLYFSVKDSGIGMTQIQCKKVFDAFEQADSSTVRKFGGTGLGLSICKDVATLLSGSISVQSKLGQGSEFTIELPLIHSLKNEPENAEAVDSLPNLEDKVFCGQSILLVEDNDINVQIAQQLLKGSNLLVDVASHGQQAVIMIQDKAYDLVLMDLQMPVMGGLEATKYIRQLGPDFQHIPIVAFSANTQQEDIEQCYKAGMQAHIPKPLELDTLNRTLSLFLSMQPKSAMYDPVVSSATNTTELSSTSILDINAALQRLNGDKALLAALYTSFAENNQNAAATAADLLNTQTSKELIGLLHTIKGSAANLGAMDLSAIAGDLETLGKQERWSDLSSSLPQLEDTLAQALSAIETALPVLRDSEVKQDAMSPAELQSALQQYFVLVDDNIVAADELVQTWQSKVFPLAFTTDMQQLLEAHEAFEMERVKQYLSVLLSKLPM